MTIFAFWFKALGNVCPPTADEAARLRDKYNQNYCVHIKRIHYGRRYIYYRSCNGWVSALDMFAVAKWTRSKCFKNLREWNIPTDILKGHGKFQGAFVSKTNALVICRRLNLTTLADMLAAQDEHGSKLDRTNRASVGVACHRGE